MAALLYVYQAAVIGYTDKHCVVEQPQGRLTGFLFHIDTDEASLKLLQSQTGSQGRDQAGGELGMMGASLFTLS